MNMKVNCAEILDEQLDDVIEIIRNSDVSGKEELIWKIENVETNIGLNFEVRVGDKCPDDFYDGRVAVSVSLDGFVPLEDDDEIIEPFETIRNIEEL